MTEHPSRILGRISTVVEQLYEAAFRDDTTQLHVLKNRFDELEADLKSALLVSELTASVKNGGV
jgi:hypothetical protein